MKSAASERGDCFRTATNMRVPNQGTRTVAGKTDRGEDISMSYSVAAIAVPLDSVSQFCDAGARVVFDRHGGYIESASGKRTVFERDGDTYSRTTWVRRCPDVPDPVFRGQRRAAS